MTHLLLSLALAGELPIPTNVLPPPNARVDDRVMPAELRPLGFSPDGKLAYVYVAPDEAIGCYLWSVHVVSLVSDGTLDSMRWEDKDGQCERVDSLEALWQHRGEEIQALLAKHGVVVDPAPQLQHSHLDREGDHLHFGLQTGVLETDRQEDRHRAPVSVTVRSEKLGTKTVGTLYVETWGGMPMTWGHEVIGVLVSPHEPRAAVLVQEVRRGWEGPPSPVTVHVFGADLDDF